MEVYTIPSVNYAYQNTFCILVSKDYPAEGIIKTLLHGLSVV